MEQSIPESRILRLAFLYVNNWLGSELLCRLHKKRFADRQYILNKKQRGSYQMDQRNDRRIQMRSVKLGHESFQYKSRAGQFLAEIDQRIAPNVFSFYYGTKGISDPTVNSKVT